MSREIKTLSDFSNGFVLRNIGLGTMKVWLAPEVGASWRDTGRAGWNFAVTDA